MDLRKVGEFEFINQIGKWMVASDPALIQGIVDGAAFIGIGSKAHLIATDTLIERIHFEFTICEFRIQGFVNSGIRNLQVFNS